MNLITITIDADREVVVPREPTAEMYGRFMASVGMMCDISESLFADAFRDAVSAATKRQQAAMDERAASLWKGGRELQIDSHATGRPQAFGWYIHGSNKVSIDLTDGHCSWSAEIEVPKDFKP